MSKRASPTLDPPLSIQIQAAEVRANRSRDLALVLADAAEDLLRRCIFLSVLHSSSTVKTCQIF